MRKYFKVAKFQVILQVLGNIQRGYSKLSVDNIYHINGVHGICTWPKVSLISLLVFES